MLLIFAYVLLALGNGIDESQVVLESQGINYTHCAHCHSWIFVVVVIVVRK